MPVAY